MEINNRKPYSRCRVWLCDVTTSNSIQDGGALVVNILVFDLRIPVQHCTYQGETLLFALIKVNTFVCKMEISGLSSPLTQSEQWPPDIVTCATKDSLSETKATKELFAMAANGENDDYDRLLERHVLRKTLRIGAWISRFLNNTRTSKEQRTTSPTTNLANRNYSGRKWEQNSAIGLPLMAEDREKLNLQPNEQWGDYPTYSQILHRMGRNLWSMP